MQNLVSAFTPIVDICIYDSVVPTVLNFVFTDIVNLFMF